MLKHLARGLETCADRQLDRLWIAVFVFGKSFVVRIFLHICCESTCNFRIVLAQEPNPEDPLNKDAANVLQTNRRLFEHNVAKAMRGNYIGGTYFECCLK